MLNKIAFFVAAALVILQAKGEDVVLCTEVGLNQCTTTPMYPGSCVHFTGELGSLDKQVSSAVIPDGFQVCTFFEQPDCSSTQENGSDMIILQGGQAYPDFSSIDSPDGVNDFNDHASSFSCNSPSGV